MLRSELYDYHQSEIIAFDIENVMLVPHKIHRIKSFFHVGEVLPLSIFRFSHPIQQGGTRLWVTHDVILYCSFCNDSHSQLVLAAKI